MIPKLVLAFASMLMRGLDRANIVSDDSSL
jgi:hypothetical protein